MRLQAFASSVMCLALLGGALPLMPAIAATPTFLEKRSDQPIDGFSVRLPQDSASFRYQSLVAGTWSEWQSYESDGDVLPGDESELIMVPVGTMALRVDGVSDPAAIHPISVSKDPVKYAVAATTAVGKPTILTRDQWGADSSYLYAGNDSTSDTTPPTDETKSDNGAGTTTTDQRARDCLDAQNKYPSEFKFASVVTKDPTGKPYLWPLQYSPQVKLLVVHHTALVVKNDPRPAVERVRALYKYHAVSKDWGDIGYNYVIDENGQIYEGRQGGKYVVGGHAYCNNVGTLGVVLMGNFEIEQPTQKQAASLQWLLADLARQYNIDLTKSVQFHGKTYDSPIVRHRDLLSTLCPGYFLAEAFGQIVKHVRTGDINAPVIFPVTSFSSSAASASSTTSQPQIYSSGYAPGIAFTGRSAISINPGGKQRLSFTYTAGPEGAYEGKRIAEVKLSTPQITLMVDDGRNWVPVTSGILLNTDLPSEETVGVQLVVQAPMTVGNYTMDIGGIHFTMSVAGRRVRTGAYDSPFNDSKFVVVTPPAPQRSSSSVSARVRPQSRPSLQTSSASASSASASAPSWFAPATVTAASEPIRIKLSSNANPTVTFTGRGSVGGVLANVGTSVSLLAKNGQCVALSNGAQLNASPVLQLQPQPSGTLTIQGIANKTRSYRGTIECRVISGMLTLINELPLDQYIEGLAEEPDSEPYEKQRAFSIAARTYAAYYMDPANRKFPGMPYDGADDPATFQSYAGVEFESANPRWVMAAQSTQGNVLQYNGAIFKPAYFSSDDGRTRSPDEAGWKNFPAAEIFTSKPDPWCKGMTLRGHGVGMSGCGAAGQAKEGRSGEQILQYYYPGARIVDM